MTNLESTDADRERFVARDEGWRDFAGGAAIGRAHLRAPNIAGMALCRALALGEARIGYLRLESSIEAPSS